MVGFTMLIGDCGAQLLTVLVLVRCPSPRCVADNGYDSTRLCYLPIAGTVVGEAPGCVHTPACLHTSPLGPTASPRPPTVWFIFCKDTYPFVATWRLCSSLGGGEAVYRQEGTYALGPSVHPPHGGLTGGNS